MNYLKIYNNIILNSSIKNRNKVDKNNINYVYYEKHHIIPKCLGGTNTEENLVLLSGREHFICHKLLTYIYKNNRKIAHAFNRMAFSKKKEYVISSRDFSYAKELIHSIPVSEETIEKRRKSLIGKKRSIESKQKYRESRIGSKNPMYGTTGEKTPRFDFTIYRFKNIKTGEIFEGYKSDLAKKLNTISSSIKRVIDGKRNTYKGYTFERIINKNDHSR
jgi:hypothetical protein